MTPIADRISEVPGRTAGRTYSLAGRAIGRLDDPVMDAILFLHTSHPCCGLIHNIHFLVLDQMPPDMLARLHTVTPDAHDSGAARALDPHMETEKALNQLLEGHMPS